MALRFSWDARKATSNRRKHGVSFEEAAAAFGDPLSLPVFDPDHADVEERYVLIGQSDRHRLLVVVHAERRRDPDYQRSARDPSGTAEL